MIKKTLLLAILMIGFTSAYAGDLSCGPKESELDKTKKTFLGETMKNKQSFIESTKSKQSVQSEKKSEKPCDEHCADKEHCEEHDHDCDDHCGDHKNHSHKTK